MHIAIIGAGIAGLISLHHAIRNNIECTVFEQAKTVGGLWVYTDKVGTDEFGLPIHTSLYEGLRSNLPVQVMGNPDFPNNITSYNYTSYVNHDDILKYIRKFADHFHLQKHIKFYNYVTKVKPIKNNQWELTSLNLQTKNVTKFHFDAIIIANGRRNTPRYPKLKGIETFHKTQIHSHDFRNPKPFTNQRVLVIGGGPSGLDITYHLSRTASKVYFSNHLDYNVSSFYPNNVIVKPDIERVNESMIYFKDGTAAVIDSILYCTGYNLTFPFLTSESGLTYHDTQYVEPLYKHMINIEHPTMAIIGLPHIISVFYLFDIQARFFMEYLKNPSKFPTKHDMYMDKANDENIRIKYGQRKNQFHRMGVFQKEYYASLSKIGQIKNIRPVITNIYDDRVYRAKTNLSHYRGDLYTILDDNHFHVVRSPIEFY